MKELGQLEMGCMVLGTQIIFLYLRTLNVKAISDNNTWKAIWTGWGIGIAWMIGIAIGVKAMMELQIFPISMHLLGGTIGTLIAMKKKNTRMT